MTAVTGTKAISESGLLGGRRVFSDEGLSSSYSNGLVAAATVMFTFVLWICKARIITESVIKAILKEEVGVGVGEGRGRGVVSQFFATLGTEPPMATD